MNKKPSSKHQIQQNKSMKKQYILHCHHETLFEELTEPIENRIEYIKENKPANEQETRLRVLKALTNKEMDAGPREALEVWEAWNKARKSCDKASEAWDKARKAWEALDKAPEAWEARDKAWEMWDKALKAWKALDKAWEKAQSSPAMTDWHKKVCKPDCPWNGQELVFLEISVADKPQPLK